MFRIRQVKIKVEEDNIDNILFNVCKKVKINIDDIINYKINKKSIDARDKNQIYFVYEIDINTNDKKLKESNDVVKIDNEDYILPTSGNNKLNSRPIIVGFGPSGLFCAYLLALKGYKPLVLERGESIDDRVKTVNDFFENNKLNINSNIQFGEGGAGTFSDGKLNTLIKDINNRMKFVYETFVDNGANPNILYSYKPHIGTDVLVSVIKNIRNKIIDLGGEIRFNTCLTDINIKDNKLQSIVLNNGEIIKTDILVLAIGHSSRDTFRMLYDKKIEMETKPFAVGYRVIHNQDMINESQYGNKYKDLLEPATYKLTFNKNNRGVYSFCMCPGGYIVDASSEENRLVVNGMSNSKRDSNTSNSAIVVTVFPRDFGNNPMDGIKFQEKLEEKAYRLGNGFIPVQLFKDFKNNKISNSFGEVIPDIKGKYAFSNLNDLLDSEFNSLIKDAIEFFGKKIKGFDNDDTILAGIESRTSSPIRIIRNDELVSNIDGIYPCGEGAGYAGGITSSAIDGMKVSELIISKYKMNKNI